ncbi:hypothetical protein RN001_004933 [Aquatica leii]|uniref:Insulin receptor substrate 1 n=1 Tax=Aquatica leii TaxID=1421715 RepID=A0AAN7PZ34_9COLE|nr:hypothetical protein RN001_004933 [Aquatica leii]
MDHDKPVYSGILLLPPQGKLLIKKTWHQRFCQLYRASKFGIERLEIYDGIDEASITKNTFSRFITLENCVKLTQRTDTSFQLITKTGAYEFSTLTHQSLLEWLAALQSVAFKDETSKVASIEEDNDLYCSSGEGVFNVKLHPSEASRRCGLDPHNYILVLTSTAIQLRDTENNKLLYTWPFRFIRRYGYRDGKFTFEAGRKCESGEGTFHLEHSNQQEIFRCLASKMKSMKKLLNNESTSTVLDCGDNQFQAALGMEARSRSPLPPSPTTSTSLQDLESHSSKSNTLFDLSFEKKINSLINPPNKLKPIKPPRKIISAKVDLSTNLSNYEPVDKYDHVEFRNEAWKTLGTNDIKHTENIDDEELEDYISWGRSKSNNSPTEQKKLPKISKIINCSTVEDGNYDRLNFFGSSSKLNTTKAGYKQVSPAPVVPVQSPPSFNDYDEVEPTMESVRIADDSHLGYAIIRKTPKDSVDHQFHNDDPYAIISKPKRV